MEFKSLNSAFKQINKDIAKVLPQVGEQVKKLVQTEIWELLYQSYTPFQYERTNDFVRSVSVKNLKILSNGSIQIEIYYDTSQIIPREVIGSKWNQHMSYSNENYSGKDMSKFIPLWLERGTEPNNGNFFPRDGIGAMGKVIENEQLRIENYLLTELRKKGYDVIFVG